MKTFKVLSGHSYIPVEADYFTVDEINLLTFIKQNTKVAMFYDWNYVITEEK